MNDQIYEFTFSGKVFGALDWDDPHRDYGDGLGSNVDKEYNEMIHAGERKKRGRGWQWSFQTNEVEVLEIVLDDLDTKANMTGVDPDYYSDIRACQKALDKFLEQFPFLKQKYEDDRRAFYASIKW